MDVGKINIKEGDVPSDGVRNGTAGDADGFGQRAGKVAERDGVDGDAAGNVDVGEPAVAVAARQFDQVGRIRKRLREDDSAVSIDQVQVDRQKAAVIVEHVLQRKPAARRHFIVIGQRLKILARIEVGVVRGADQKVPVGYPWQRGR